MKGANSLVIAQYNVENLFLFMDKYQGEDITNLTEKQWRRLSTATPLNKPLRKLWGVAAAISDIDPDVLLLNEVGGLESLKNFNEYFLKGQYLPLLNEGNSNRGIDVGFLVKRSLPFNFEVKSNRDRSINFTYPHEKPNPPNKPHGFSRDVAELHMIDPDSHTTCLIILLTHLKSKLDPGKIDAFGSLRREAEAKTLVEIYNELSKKDLPILVGGDFNGNASSINTEHEFESIYTQSDLACCLETAGRTDKERMTQIQLLYGGKSRYLQLDYIFAGLKLQPWIVKEETYVYRYNTEGAEHPFPKNLEQRAKLPSDHYPVVLTLNRGILN